MYVQDCRGNISIKRWQWRLPTADGSASHLLHLGRVFATWDGWTDFGVLRSHVSRTELPCLNRRSILKSGIRGAILMAYLPLVMNKPSWRVGEKNPVPQLSVERHSSGHRVMLGVSISQNHGKHGTHFMTDICILKIRESINHVLKNEWKKSWSPRFLLARSIILLCQWDCPRNLKEKLRWTMVSRVIHADGVFIETNIYIILDQVTHEGTWQSNISNMLIWKF